MSTTRIKLARGLLGGAMAMSLGAALAGPALLAAPSESELERGRQIYLQHCAICHGSSFAGAFGPPVSGKNFVDRWRGQSIEAFEAHIRTMPPGAPDSLSDAEYKALVSLLRNANGLPQGDDKAAPVPVAAADAPVPAAPERPHGGATVAGPVDETYLNHRARLQALADRLPVVTDAMLQKPDPANWLNWRRTQDAAGFSPLNQIDRTNAASLTLAWALPLGPGTNAITPLVHDGVMFIDTGSVQALDARNGDVIWRFARKSRPARLPLTQARGLAIYGDMIYQPTTDNHLIALDMRTGAVRWDVKLASTDPDQLQVTAAPLAVKGKIIQGISGCQGATYKGGCYVVALDAASGKEVWRFHSIARPGQPGGDSWNGAPVEERFGGSVWTTPSYDADLDLLYVPTAQTYRSSTLLKPNARKGASGDALFTNSTLALRPDTGELAWHYQHFPGDVWDLDWSFEQTVVPVDGRKTVLTIGKLGIIDAVDAKTGKYLWSKDLGLQSVVTAIDPRTGRKSFDPNLLPALGVPKVICPGSLGARNWAATAIDPQKGRLFVPMVEGCMNFTLLDTADGPTGDQGMELIKRPDTDGKFGRITAVDLAGREIAWSERGRAASASAMLATAGGLVFEGTLDRRFRARDSDTGKVLWETRLDDSPHGFPITFAVDGAQYVAVASGGGMPFDLGFRAFTPEEQGGIRQRTLWVFKLPAR